MPQAVVNQLESIEIEKHHRQHRPVSLCPDNGLGERSLKNKSVRQAGQNVVLRNEFVPSFGGLAQCDVLVNGYKMADRAARVRAKA